MAEITGQATTAIFEGLIARVRGLGGIDFNRVGSILLLLAGLYLASALLSFFMHRLVAGVTAVFSRSLRDDIGNSQVGDGALYKGRGFVQLTGKSNYISIGAKLGVNLRDNPDLANDPQTAAKILAEFLKTHETAIRTALKTNNLALARKKVNGGSHGLHEFTQSFAAGRKYLGIVVPQKAKAATNVKVTRK